MTVILRTIILATLPRLLLAAVFVTPISFASGNSTMTDEQRARVLSILRSDSRAEQVTQARGPACESGACGSEAYSPAALRLEGSLEELWDAMRIDTSIIGADTLVADEQYIHSMGHIRPGTLQEMIESNSAGGGCNINFTSDCKIGLTSFHCLVDEDGKIKSPNLTLFHYNGPQGTERLEAIDTELDIVGGYDSFPVLGASASSRTEGMERVRVHLPGSNRFNRASLSEAIRDFAVLEFPPSLTERMPQCRPFSVRTMSDAELQTVDTARPEGAFNVHAFNPRFQNESSRLITPASDSEQCRVTPLTAGYRRLITREISGLAIESPVFTSMAHHYCDTEDMMSGGGVVHNGSLIGVHSHSVVDGVSDGNTFIRFQDCIGLHLLLDRVSGENACRDDG